MDSSMIDTAVLLSTYNGEKYLEAQLDSLLAQTDTNYLLMLRDDGSTDQTLSILQRKINLFRHVQWAESSENLGAKLSFAHLIEVALENPNVKYIMFCDQDDVWLPRKIEQSKREIKQREEQFGDQLPILIHSDLHVVDEELRIIDPSFVKYQNLDLKKSSLNRLLVQNIVTGCTMIFNRKLAILSCPVPTAAIMHDWWIALVATAFGHISVTKETLIYYRQHNLNTVGASRYVLSNNTYKKYKKRSIIILFDQADALFFRFEERFSSWQYQMIRQFIQLKTVPRISKIKIMCTRRFFKHGLYRNIGFLLKLMQIGKGSRIQEKIGGRHC